MGVVYRQKGRTTWMLKYDRDGRPIYESSGTDIKDEAKKMLRVREGDIAKGAADHLQDGTCSIRGRREGPDQRLQGQRSQVAR